MQPLVIPYKALSRCSIDELAAQQQLNEQRLRNSGGVLFARKDERDEKNAARKAITDLPLFKDRSRHLSILSMPGLHWTFEVELLAQREPGWRKERRQACESMRLTCVENDRFVYYSATTKMPGNKHCTLRSLERPAFAERAMGNGLIDRFAFANVDDLMAEGGETFDIAWLDYTGPLSVDRMKLIQRFWARSVRDTLIVTSLKARWNRETSNTIDRNGGVMNWLRSRLPGDVLHEIEYQDGFSPMAQFAIAKATGSAS